MKQLNIKQKYGGGLTASEAMELSNKYNEALVSIDYYKHEAKKQKYYYLCCS